MIGRRLQPPTAGNWPEPWSRPPAAVFSAKGVSARSPDRRRFEGMVQVTDQIVGFLQADVQADNAWTIID